jgi:hypothetical protein
MTTWHQLSIFEQHVERLFPVEPLVEYVGSSSRLRAEARISGIVYARWRDEGLTEREADNAAARCGVPAELIWPGFLDESD